VKRIALGEIMIVKGSGSPSSNKSTPGNAFGWACSELAASAIDVKRAPTAITAVKNNTLKWFVFTRSSFACENTK
jgi:hypothetical protein